VKEAAKFLYPMGGSARNPVPAVKKASLCFDAKETGKECTSTISTKNYRGHHTCTPHYNKNVLLQHFSVSNNLFYFLSRQITASGTLRLPKESEIKIFEQLFVLEIDLQQIFRI